MSRDIPANPATWSAEFAELAYACAAADAGQAGALIAAACRLLGCDGAGNDALVAGGADAAALRLVEARAGYMLSHGIGGSHVATVVLAGQNAETSAEGASAALALLGALAAALAGLGSDPARGALRPAPGAGLRLN
jgi:hypothetical protein